MDICGFLQPWISHFPLSNLCQGEIGFLEVVAMYSLICGSASSFIPFCKIQFSQSPLWSAGARVRGLATLAFFRDYLCHIVSHINELTYSSFFLCVLFQYVFPSDFNFFPYSTQVQSILTLNSFLNICQPLAPNSTETTTVKTQTRWVSRLITHHPGANNEVLAITV